MSTNISLLAKCSLLCCLESAVFSGKHVFVVFFPITDLIYSFYRGHKVKLHKFLILNTNLFPLKLFAR